MSYSYGPLFEARAKAFAEWCIAYVDGHRPHPSGPRTCGVDDHCDPLAVAIDEQAIRAIPLEDVELFVRVTPEAPPDLLDWTNDDPLRNTIAGALREELWELVFPNHSIRPVMPFTDG